MNKYFIIFLLLFSCTKEKELTKLKKELSDLDSTLSAIHQEYNDVKFAQGFKINNSEQYEIYSEKYLNYDNPELYFSIFLKASIIYNYEKAYNDICKIFIKKYKNNMEEERYFRIKNFCLYNLARSYELGYRDNEEEFRILGVSPQKLKKSQYYFKKSFEY